MQNNSIALQKEEEKSLLSAGFFKTAMTLLMSPGDFFTKNDFGADYGYPLQFLFICSLISTLLSSIFSVENQLFSASLNFANALIMPLVTSAILYAIINILFKKGVRYTIIFSITCFSSVTLFFSWIPGLSLFVGIWHYCLIGIGLIKAASFSTLKACLLILASLVVLLASMKLIGVMLWL